MINQGSFLILPCRFLQGPEIPERQLYKEPPEAFLEADNMDEVITVSKVNVIPPGV